MGFLQPFDRRNIPEEWPNKLRYAFHKAYQGFDVIPPILLNVDGWHYEMLVDEPLVLKIELAHFALSMDTSILRGAGNLLQPAV